MKYNNLSYSWSNKQASQKKLPIKSNSQFIYIHNPQNWELVYIDGEKKSKAVLLPELSVLRLTAGVNLVRKNNSNVAIANVQSQGSTIIDPEKYDYIRVYPCTNGNRYEDSFVSFENLGGSLIRNYDTDGFNQFRCSLMRDGVITPPHEHFIKIMINDNQKLIDKYSQLQHNPNHEALYKKAIQKDKDLKQVKQALKKDGVKIYESTTKSNHD